MVHLLTIVYLFIFQSGSMNPSSSNRSSLLSIQTVKQTTEPKIITVRSGNSVLIETKNSRPAQVSSSSSSQWSALVWTYTLLIGCTGNMSLLEFWSYLCNAASHGSYKVLLVFILMFAFHCRVCSNRIFPQCPLHPHYYERRQRVRRTELYILLTDWGRVPWHAHLALKMKVYK